MTHAKFYSWNMVHIGDIGEIVTKYGYYAYTLR